MKYAYLALILLAVGCSNKGVTYQQGQLHCGNCNRVIYDGEFEVHPNGFKWPVGEFSNCPAWDINCVNDRIEGWDKKYKSQIGYKDGRKDALEFKYRKIMDAKTHHHYYIEAYNKGYQEVIEVRRSR